MNDLETILCEHIATAAHLDRGLIGSDTDLVRDLGLNSLELLRILAFAEERFGTTIPDRELVGLTTVRRIAVKVRQLCDRNEGGQSEGGRGGQKAP